MRPAEHNALTGGPRAFVVHEHHPPNGHPAPLHPVCAEQWDHQALREDDDDWGPCEVAA